MNPLSPYIAQDRRKSLACNRALPEQARGTALFADVSGFTALTEALALSLGRRRGAEELSTHLNSVYEALVQDVDDYGGSVVAFAGDAITCWFEGDDGALAVACAMAMQKSMGQFAEVRLPGGDVRSLAVKVGIAGGTAKRFEVGSPSIQLIDVLAGKVLMDMADATALAGRGEVIITENIALPLAQQIEVREWRTSKYGSSRFAVLGEFKQSVPTVKEAPDVTLSEPVLLPHLLGPVHERIKAGKGEFLTELRPAVALFLKFEGLDYDHDAEVGKKLDAYVTWVQEVVNKFGGYVLMVAVGDKGSVLYCSFGAPIAHENSAWRATSAGHELRLPPSRFPFITACQVGISAGTMRTGAYGSTTRRTYGVLGDDVNLAARLMEHAGKGEVLVSQSIHRETSTAFEWEERAPLKAKGKTGLIPAFALQGPGGGAKGKVEVEYALPMVGRAAELQRVRECVDAAMNARGRVIRLSAGAGMGKSRLSAEAANYAQAHGLACFQGHCLSHGTHTAYLGWRNIWRELFGLPGTGDSEALAQHLHHRLSEINPDLTVRLPLLGSLLDIPIEDNEITRHLEARLRKASLEALLLDCLRFYARRAPLLITLEDAQWMDPLSRDLFEELARSIGRLPVVLLLTGRPPEAGSNAVSFDQLKNLNYYLELTLPEFSESESTTLIENKLAQLFDYRGEAPRELVRLLTARAAGNPFYLEELLNFLKDQGGDFLNPATLAQLELPASLHTLILSRIDRLTQNQQALLKIASVIGRLFPIAVIWGIQRQADRQSISVDLQGLCEADLTAVDRPEPELIYIFKQVVTQEVTYESLPHAMRAILHNQIGLCLEQIHPERPPLDLLAFHFDRTENLPKKREYLVKAGEAAQAQYANLAAVNYFERALPLLGPADRANVALKLGKVFELLGEWKKAGACYQRAFENSQTLGDVAMQARCQAATGDLLRKQGMFAEAADWLDVARTHFQEINDQAGVGQTLHALGTVHAIQGQYDQARQLYERSLEIRRNLKDKPQIASLLSNLSIVIRFGGDFELCRQLVTESLQIRREVGDRWAIANSLNNLGVVLRDLREFPLARATLEECLTLNTQVGDRWAIANTLSSLAEVALDQQDWSAARDFLAQSLEINLHLGDRTAVAFTFECFAGMAAAEGKSERALRLVGSAESLRNEIGSPLSPVDREKLEEYLKPARAALTPAQQQQAFTQGASEPLDKAVEFALAECHTTVLKRIELPLDR